MLLQYTHAHTHTHTYIYMDSISLRHIWLNSIDIFCLHIVFHSSRCVDVIISSRNRLINFLQLIRRCPNLNKINFESSTNVFKCL